MYIIGDGDAGWSFDSRPGEVCPARRTDLYTTTEGCFQLKTKQFGFFSTGDVFFTSR